jgi:hypothetical protein
MSRQAPDATGGIVTGWAPRETWRHLQVACQAAVARLVACEMRRVHQSEARET